MDAGLDVDAGVVADAGLVADAGVVADAAEGMDAGLGADAGGVPDAGAAPDAAAPDGGAGQPAVLAGRSVSLYLNLGDSFAAGYNAGGGRGYFDLVCANHPDYPAYATDNLRARFPGLQCRSRAESGATSADLAGQARSLPDNPSGDTVVTIYVGGNDFNDDVATMISRVATQAAITRYEQNVTQTLARLRQAYEDPAAGRHLVVLLATIHDPTDGTGEVPARFQDGFCGRLHHPLFTPALRAQALANLAAFNDAIRALAAREGASVMDSHDALLGHGMTAPDPDRWLDTDCTHGTREGHHQVRRLIWRLFFGAAP